MTDFVARVLGRARGGTGVRPLIAPITAPASWEGPIDLEFAEQHAFREVDEPTPETRRRSERTPSDAAERSTTALQRAPASHEDSLASSPADTDLGIRRRGVEREELESIAAPSMPGPIDSRSTTVVSTRGARGTPDLRSHAVQRNAQQSPMVRSESPLAIEALDRDLEVESLGELVSPGAPRVPALRASVRRAPDFADLESLSLDLYDEPTYVPGASPQRSIGSKGTASFESATPSHPLEDAFSSPDGPSPGRARALSHSSAPVDGPIEPTQLPIPMRRRGAAGDQVVRVEIGRIELRAAAREPTSTARDIPKPEGFVSLKQYLQERGSR